MITTSITPFQPLNGVEQIATTWRVALDREMTSLVYENKNTNKDTMYVLLAFITMERGQTLWVQATRHFNNGNLDFASDPIPISNDKQDISQMLQQPDIFIDTPMVSVDEAELKDMSLGYFTVRTTKYRGNYSAHLFTSWIIKDEEDNVLWTSLRDEENLREIRVSKDISLMGKNKLIIYAIHGTNNSVESKPGKAYVVLGSLNFKIISDLNNVLPQTNYALRIQRLDDKSPSYITRVAIRNLMETETIWETPIEEEVEEVIIPWYTLGANSKYVVVITATNSIGMFVDYKKLLETRITKLVDVTNIYNECNYNLRKIEDNKINIPESFSTIELLDRSILVPDGTVLKKYYYDYNTSVLTATSDTVDGVTLLSRDNNNTYIKYLENNYLLIDTLNEDNKPTFMVYYHNLSNNTYSLLRTVVRDDEIEPIGITNSIVQISPYVFIYLPFNGNSLYKFDIRKTSVEKLSIIPSATDTEEDTEDEEDVKTPTNPTKPRYGILVKINNNRLLVLSGDTFLTHVYNVKGNYFVEGITISPGSFIGKPLQAKQLLNGSTLIYKTHYREDDKEISMLYFNYVTSRIERLSIQFDKDRFPTGSISLANGDTLFYCHNDPYRAIPENTKLQIFN